MSNEQINTFLFSSTGSIPAEVKWIKYVTEQHFLNLTFQQNYSENFFEKCKFLCPRLKTYIQRSGLEPSFSYEVTVWKTQ